MGQELEYDASQGRCFECVLSGGSPGADPVEGGLGLLYLDCCAYDLDMD